MVISVYDIRSPPASASGQRDRRRAPSGSPSTGWWAGRRRWFASSSGFATSAPRTCRWSDPGLQAAFGASFELDSLGRVVRQMHASSDTTRSYAYDERGWLAARADSTFEAPEVECETDGQSITGVECTSTGGGFTRVGGADYDYDRVGNRTDAGATLEAGNRLTAFNGHALTWNDAGQLTHKQGGGLDQRFFWSATGRLDSVETNGTVTRFAYDAFSRRVSKTVGGETTQYVYAGDDVQLELDGAENVEARYSYLPGTDRPHSVVRTGSTYYYARGRTNSVAGLFDEAGQVVNRYRYAPWGRAESAVEGVENAYRFAGRRYDASTGLYYNRARYYDPGLARFISRDPLGLAAGLNPFVYAGNDPVNATDPSGMCPTWLSAWLLRNFYVVCPVPVSDITVGDGGGGGTDATFPERGPRRGAVTTAGLPGGMVGGGGSLNVPSVRRRDRPMPHNEIERTICDVAKDKFVGAGILDGIALATVLSFGELAAGRAALTQATEFTGTLAAGTILSAGQELGPGTKLPPAFNSELIDGVLSAAGVAIPGANSLRAVGQKTAACGSIF